MDDFLPATEGEKAYMVQMRPSTTFFKDGMKRLFRNKIATLSLIVIVLVTLAALILPAFWPYSYDTMLGVRPGKPVDPSYNNLAPFEYGETELAKIAAGEKVFPHIFGTDSAGRDYFIRVVYGTRISLAVGFFASIIVLIIGMSVGSLAGYLGGKVDLIIMRIVDIIYSLPDMLMVILLASVLKQSGLNEAIEGTVLEKLGGNIISLFIIFALLYWVSMSRQIRGQILSLKEQEYVLAAKSTGAKASWVICKHLLPNSTITLTKNENYHGAADVTMNEIKFYLSDDANNMLTNFKNGTWQLIDDVPTNEIAALKVEYPDEFVVAGQIGTYYVCWNINEPLLPKE